MDEVLAGIRELKLQFSSLDAKVGALDAKVGALDAKVGALDAKVGALDAKVTARLDGIDSSVLVLLAAGANERVRLNNSLKANAVALQPFAFDREGKPWPSAVKQPQTLLDLAVAGNENKPGTSVKPAWNKASSQAFLKTAVVGYDDEGTDGEGEVGAMARTARIKVIQAVGGDVANVFATQYRHT